MDFTKQLADKFLLAIFSYFMELPLILPPSAGDPALTLLVICHRWRHLILHSPNRWTNLIISPTVSSNNFHANVKFDSCWLKLDIHRHSGHWLYISLLHDYRAPSSSQKMSTAIQTSGVEIDMLEDIIFPAAARTKCISLPFCSNGVAEAFLTSPSGRFYFLESLEMRFLECGHPETVILDSAAGLTRISKPITSFQNSPFLRHTSLIINNGMNPLTLLLPWYQLTTINMGFTTIPPKVFITILATSPSLSTGFFTIKLNPNLEKRSGRKKNRRLPRIFARALKHLHLRLINPSFNRDTFKRFRFPALSSFRVDLYDSNAGWMIDMYKPLLRNSSSTLQQVEFWNFLLPGGLEGTEEKTVLGGPHLIIPPIQQDFDAFFSILPMVRMLHLPVGLYIPETVMELIAQGELLPLLETLEVASYTGVDILAMVKKRNEGAYRRGGFIGSSNAAPNVSQYVYRVPSAFFSEVVLWTSIQQVRHVKSYVEFIGSLSSSQTTRFRVLYMDQESLT